VHVTDELKSKADITPETVAALAARAGIEIAPDRIDVIAQRLSDLFDLAAPLEDAAVEDVTVTRPFDPRWTGEANA
jgi:Asp-tRNA(Asn)/Glu-tRNA(Gln) amidotransferase C subunit